MELNAVQFIGNCIFKFCSSGWPFSTIRPSALLTGFFRFYYRQLSINPIHHKLFLKMHLAVLKNYQDRVPFFLDKQVPKNDNTCWMSIISTAFFIMQTVSSGSFDYDSHINLPFFTSNIINIPLIRHLYRSDLFSPNLRLFSVMAKMPIVKGTFYQPSIKNTTEAVVTFLQTTVYFSYMNS